MMHFILQFPSCITLYDTLGASCREKGLRSNKSLACSALIFCPHLTSILHARNPGNRPQSMHQTTPRFSTAQLQRKPRSSRHNLYYKLSSLCSLVCTSLCSLSRTNVPGTCPVLSCLAFQEEEARLIAEEEAKEEAARKAVEEEKARKRAKAKEKVCVLCVEEILYVSCKLLFCFREE